MTTHDTRERGRVRLLPAAPRGFDPLDATAKDLARFGLPRRPDAHAEADLAALWERKAAQYRDFEHLAPAIVHTGELTPAPALGPDAVDSAGFTLTTAAGPFTTLFATWTVPDMQYDDAPFAINEIHTFVGLGFLDAHVHLAVTASGAVTCGLWGNVIGETAMAVRPGDVISASLCLNTNPAGTAAYFFTNETTAQTMSFSADTFYPPAVTVNAGVTRDGVIRPGQPLARFGTVYFDELSAYNSTGRKSMTAGESIDMVDPSGAALAHTYVMTDYAFKVVHS
jgi:hypothetical protein